MQVAAYDGDSVSMAISMVMVILIGRGQHRSILPNWFQLSCKMSTKLDCSDDKDLRKYFDNSPLYIITLRENIYVPFVLICYSNKINNPNSLRQY